MRLVRVQLGMDRVFRRTLDAIGRFTEELPEGAIPFGWYAPLVCQMFSQADPRLLLLAVLDDTEEVVGHLLAIAELHYGTPKLHIYQGNIVRHPDSRAIVDEGFAMVLDFARQAGCRTVTMATRREPRAMRRRFGFKPKYILMERGL